MEGFPKSLLWGQTLMLEVWLTLSALIHQKVEIRTLLPPNSLILVFMPFVLVRSWVGREEAIPKLFQHKVLQNVLCCRVPQQLCGRRLPGCPSQTHPLRYNTTDTWLCNNNTNKLHRRYPVVRYQAGVTRLLRFFLKCLYLCLFSPPVLMEVSERPELNDLDGWLNTFSNIMPSGRVGARLTQSRHRYISGEAQSALPSSSALSDALWTPRSFSPLLSACQTTGCESSRCFWVLQPKVAKWISPAFGRSSSNSLELCLTYALSIDQKMLSKCWNIEKNSRTKTQPVGTGTLSEAASLPDFCVSFCFAGKSQQLLPIFLLC